MYSAAQGLLAALAGAKYVAPYVNRVDARAVTAFEWCRSYKRCSNSMRRRARYWPPVSKHRASALDCLLAGCEAITLPLDVAQQMLNTPAVESAVEKFEQDWKTAFGNLNL